jgi:hypothetical protein
MFHTPRRQKTAKGAPMQAAPMQARMIIVSTDIAATDVELCSFPRVRRRAKKAK